MTEHPMNGRDEQAAELRARFPGWHIWFVVSAVQRTASWHATPGRYPLNAASAEDMAAAIEADEARPARS
jgi:hypothetical protein